MNTAGTLMVAIILFLTNPLLVTICPETFSNRCVDSVKGM